MARVATVTLTDDIDGTKGSETITFSLDGRAYEIDLSVKNAQRLRKTMDQFTTHARKVRATAGPTTSRRQRPRPDHDPAAVREWAQQQGIAVSSKGRISAQILTDYLAAH